MLANENSTEPVGGSASSADPRLQDAARDAASPRDGNSSFTAPHSRNELDYRRLANALPLVIWTCNAHGRLEWVSQGWKEFTGLSDEETLESKGALFAVHPDDRGELRKRWGQALLTSAPCEIEYRIRNCEGDYRWHLCRVAPVRDEAGAITCRGRRSSRHA